MEKMLVTQALNELKTLDARIRKGINYNHFVGSTRTSSDNVCNMTKKDFAEHVKSTFESINSLIDRRNKIKSAIIMSNAQTKVIFNGKEYTVAELIDMKSAIEYKELLLKILRSEYDIASKEVDSNNAIMQSKIDRLVETSLGTEKKKTDDINNDIESISAVYRKNNEYSLVDPINALDKIAELEKFIQEFVSNVDSILQISNCTTYIEI